MATRPTGSTTRGVFFAYPQDATGSPTPYWLAGGGTLVRMTGACKCAFLATIEAVLERAVAPATCGTYPDGSTDLKTVYIGTGGVSALISLGTGSSWASAANRAALGAKLVRGCPEEEWDRLLTTVADLWRPAAPGNDAGSVYAWQVDCLEYDTGGFVAAMSGQLVFDDLGPNWDLSAYFADVAARNTSLPELRPWGDFGGGSGLVSTNTWLVDAFDSFGVAVVYGSDSEPTFAEEQLNGNPKPLAEGHEGNWFASAPSTMVGQTPSVRRSSSAWAVLQAMLANMKFTHLAFSYEHLFGIYRTTRAIRRYVTMDELTGDIYCEEEYDTETTTYEAFSSEASISTNQSFTDGTASRQVRFFCNDSDVAALAVFARPADGWSKVGTALVSFLTFGTITTGGGHLELERTKTTEVTTIRAGGSTHFYPAVGMRSYVRQYRKATFIDRETYTEGSQTQWTRYSVRPENGSYDLEAPTRDHAQWLLSQLPSMPFPSIPSCPSTLTAETAAFWANWEVYYPTTPNIQINGQDAYFPAAFRNDTFTSPTDIPISHVNNAWESGSQYECVFGFGRMAFPGLDQISYGDRSYVITPYDEALAGYEWQFKAMVA